jgi:hypothetical protein
MRSVTPQKLCLAVAKHAKGMGQYRRVCYVVVSIDSGKIEHVDNHFRTATDAKKHARKFGLNGYFYPMYERKEPIREFFPSANQIMKFISHGAFAVFVGLPIVHTRKLQPPLPEGNTLRQVVPLSDRTHFENLRRTERSAARA